MAGLCSVCAAPQLNRFVVRYLFYLHSHFISFNKDSILSRQERGGIATAIPSNVHPKQSRILIMFYFHSSFWCSLIYIHDIHICTVNNRRMSNLEIKSNREKTDLTKYEFDLTLKTMEDLMEFEEKWKNRDFFYKWCVKNLWSILIHFII